MKIHHLNCGTMRPVKTPEGLVCHVLLVETDNGLVLVDTGPGLRDAAEPSSGSWPWTSAPRSRPPAPTSPSMGTGAARATLWAQGKSASPPVWSASESLDRRNPRDLLKLATPRHSPRRSGHLRFTARSPGGFSLANTRKGEGSLIRSSTGAQARGRH